MKVNYRSVRFPFFKHSASQATFSAQNSTFKVHNRESKHTFSDIHQEKGKPEKKIVFA